MIARRTLLVAATGACLAARMALAGGVFENITFKIVRKGSDIGWHAIRFERQGAGAKVTTVIDIKVKMAFITVASFQQEAVETWQEGGPIEGRSRIIDDGDIFDVSFSAQGQDLLVLGPKGQVKAPVGTMTDISFWNQDIVRQHVVIDLKMGDLERMLSKGGSRREMVDLGNGSQMEGMRYEFSGSRGRSGVVWYDSTGRFIRTSFTTRGEQLEYYPI
ncbi:MAG TPA: DUF6134 family protein [Geminicoccus sp.]|uniref:DUF6134 family protein n=1 Tax=Geminicoccus sp. TaxID=2024832 RepID=UPI002C3DA20A|nr:DUF6134 family protein [Geminicoccus sp.]HWL69666.1 DUF6134 family protein [Geminicoccus sp.]